MKVVKYNWYLLNFVDIVAWCFSTTASVATVLSTHPSVSSFQWVKKVQFHYRSYITLWKLARYGDWNMVKIINLVVIAYC